MYQYDGFDKAFVAARAAEFRDQVARRLSGALSEDEFKPLRLQNGLYLQLHAYMLRIAIPYGTLGSDQLRQLAYIAERYDRGYGHFTTRQNIQFNWIKLEDAADILVDLADVEMHAIQTSGNCIRNVTTDAFAGAAPDEIEDPRVTAELLRQWSTSHPEFAFLPRKFKIAVTATEHDRAATAVHDIGVAIVKTEAGEIGYRISVGGGLGRTPMIAKVIREFLPKRDLLRYLTAIMRTYNLYGRRDNKYKARVKILVHEAGLEEVRARVEDIFDGLDADDFAPNAALTTRIENAFAPPPLEETAARALEAFDPELRSWIEVNTVPHKVSGHRIVTISLKPIGAPPGDATAEQMRLVADLADRFSQGEIRVSHEQNLVLPHVREADLSALYGALKGARLATANAGLVSDIIACPGLDYCALATARSIPIAQAISERFADGERAKVIGELKIKISGCINACGHHHVGHIGILGLEKAGRENYQITIGGDATETAAIGARPGPGFDAEEVPGAIERLIDAYLERRTGPEERFVDAVRRLGVAPFKTALYEEEARHAA